MRLILFMIVALLLSLTLAIGLGETPLRPADYMLAFARSGSAPGEILWSIRAPRALSAAVVGGFLGLSGAVMQGLLRNPLADPGVLGVSAMSALGAAAVIALGLAASPGAVEAAALAGAAGAGIIITLVAARIADPTVLILFGVALSSFGGAATSLVLNLAPSPVAATEILSWLMGSVANRDWADVVRAVAPGAVGAALCVWSGPGLRILTLGEETAALSGLRMGRLRAAAVAGAALLTGAAVALSGVIGFVGLAAPHLVRRAVDEDPAAVLLPSALGGAVLALLADLMARLLPTPEELRLGVVTALFGAPLFALLAWRAARSWRR